MPRPHLGERRTIFVKVKPPLHDAVKRAANAQGETITDFVAGVLEQAITASPPRGRRSSSRGGADRFRGDRTSKR
jgi:hypothetical protein